MRACVRCLFHKHAFVLFSPTNQTERPLKETKEAHLHTWLFTCSLFVREEETQNEKLPVGCASLGIWPEVHLCVFDSKTNDLLFVCISNSGRSGVL